MRIFTAVRHSSDPKFYYGKLWSSNFHPALTQLGHEIIQSEIDLLPASCFMHIPDRFDHEELSIRGKITDQIIEEVKIAHTNRPIDIFLCYFYNAHFDPAGFDEIHQLGIPTINFYCNSIYQFELVNTIAPKVTFAWHAEKHAQQLYLQVGAKPIWVQMGADPDIYYPLPVATRQAKACFVGQRYADRDRWMAALIDAGLPISIYGPGWGESKEQKSSLSQEGDERQSYLGRTHAKAGSTISYIHAVKKNIQENGFFKGSMRSWQQVYYRRQTQQLTPLFTQFAKGAIPFQEICTIFSSYEVILNFSNVWSDGRPGTKLIPHVRLRDFEAPMCRTCYLTGHTDEIAEFYEIGKEIDTYQSKEELIDKIQFYLTHSDKAEKLRHAGYQRALRDHSWKSRFKQLFREIGVEK